MIGEQITTNGPIKIKCIEVKCSQFVTYVLLVTYHFQLQTSLVQWL